MKFADLKSLHQEIFSGGVLMVKSMTGFGKAEFCGDKYEVSIEIKTVNSRYIDFNCKISRGYLALEDLIKKAVALKLSRGKIDAYIVIKAIGENAAFVEVDLPLAKSYDAALREMAKNGVARYDGSASFVAQMPNVLSVKARNEDENELFSEYVSPCVEKALEGLIKMREAEGKRLNDDILIKLEKIKSFVKFIEEKSPETATVYYEKIKSKISEMLKDTDVSEQLILTEAAIYADRASIDEELVRLNSHINGMYEILNENAPVGRKLDFLVQEMNRETNTIGSKCSNVEITKKVILIKNELEKIREQVQNIE